MVLQLAAFMERESVRLIHANDYYANLLAVPAAKLVRAKVICSRLDLRHWAFGAQRAAEALALRGADAVMVNAQFVREKCVREDGLSASKVYVVHNGVDVAAFGKPIAPERPTVAVIANLDAAKGHLDLIEAASRMRDVQFLCAGEGPMRPVLEQQIAFHGLMIVPVLATLAGGRTLDLVRDGVDGAAALAGGYHLAWLVGAATIVITLVLAISALRRHSTASMGQLVMADGECAA